MIRKPFLLLPLILLAACAAPVQAERPADFQAQYHWSTGSLPPPYNYNYTITIGPEASGTIVFKADYRDGNPINRTETFPLGESDLDGLYARLYQIGAFSKTWQQVKDIPDGGSVSELTMTAYGGVYSIPAYIDGDDQASDMHSVYGKIEALVPQEVWDEWYVRHEQYIAENKD